MNSSSQDKPTRGWFALSTPVSAVLLAAIVIWPAVHLSAIHQIGLNPWEFGGWAMYSTPESGWSLSSVQADEREVDPYSLPAEAQEDLRGLAVAIGKYGLLGTFGFPLQSVSKTTDATFSETMELVRPRLCRGSIWSNDSVQLTAVHDGNIWKVRRSYSRGCVASE